MNLTGIAQIEESVCVIPCAAKLIDPKERDEIISRQYTAPRGQFGYTEMQMLIDAIWPGCPKDTPFEDILERAKYCSESFGPVLSE